MAKQRRDPVADSIWTRPPRGRAAEPGLGRDQIVAAALAICDSEGLAGLSMRKLGARLGSGATSVYWHVPTKDDLLDLLLDAAMGELPAPRPEDGPWREVMAEYARAMRATITGHPWVTTLLSSRAPIGPQSTRAGDAVLGVLLAAGFDGKEAAYVSSAISGYAVGIAFGDVTWQSTVAASGMSEDDFFASIRKHVTDDGGANYQAVMVGVDREGVDKVREQAFEFGLQRLLDGLESWRATGSRPTRGARGRAGSSARTSRR